MGYHKDEIEKGVYGEASKIREECDEFLDAVKQGNVIMSLVELSDLLGAIEGYIYREFDGRITMEDLGKMKEATREAFWDGTRK